MAYRFLQLVLVFALAPFTAHAADVELRSGDIVLLRHASAPGVGDPPGFKLDDCATQRNLSDAGRAEARRFGEEMKRRGVRIGAVLTSQWCRTRDTAKLAFPGIAARDEPSFNSWFGQVPVESEGELKKARDVLRRWSGPGVLVVVSHQINIHAITGVPTASAEAVVVRKDAKGELAVAGTIQAP
ncbi:histidine phosphatase family protein [Ramlibacter sp. PS4R-6]|uniref:histidine phosphatase family protein n=1 Tax=Ramlibacter sp. PS4R-6 TaxID=3133438 RepID=UPI0030A88817